MQTAKKAWEKYKTEKTKDPVLLPDTVRFICEVNGFDTEKSVSTSLKSSRKSQSKEMT